MPVRASSYGKKSKFHHGRHGGTEKSSKRSSEVRSHQEELPIHRKLVLDFLCASVPLCLRGEKTLASHRRAVLIEYSFQFSSDVHRIAMFNVAALEHVYQASVAEDGDRR